MKKLPLGNDLAVRTAIRSSKDLGAAVRRVRTRQKLTQLDLAGLANTGNRFIVELEQGKPTVQLQKALEILSLLGLELTVSPRGARHDG